MEALLGLLEENVKAAGAPELAAAAGAERLCLFVCDPELHRFLPGPGFPQRLPHGLEWARFVNLVSSQGFAEAELLSPYTGEPQKIWGIRLDESSIAVFLGGAVDRAACQVLAPGLRIVCALLQERLRTRLAEISASLSNSLARESRELADALSDAHDQLTASLRARERLLEEVARQQEQLQLARRISGIGLWDLNLSTRQLSLSHEAAAIFGLPAQAATRPLSDLLNLVHPEDRDRVARSLTTRDRELTLQFRIVGNDGASRWIENRATIIGERNLLIGLSLDVTQRVMTEQALIRSEKLAAAGRLAASIAHEINNPLAALVNLIYVAQHSNEVAQIQELLRTAAGELERVSHVARQSLAFYRDSNIATRFDLAATLRRAATLFRKQIPEGGVSLMVDLPDEPVEIDGWPGEVTQLALNLMVNAAQASAGAGRMGVRCRRIRGLVRLTVSDEGHGIADEHLRRIFEPFFTTKKDAGTGLGLWITQQIVVKHHGYIRVRTSTAADRHGTVISVTLPAAGSVRELTSGLEPLRDQWQMLRA